MPKFLFSKCPNCKKENRDNWLDLTSSKPGAKVFRSVNLPADREQRSFVVTCKYCHARYKVTLPQSQGEDHANA
ncbi:MAG: hypothetical protein ACOYYF_06460 [Chloroflexota bacterium]|nr:hypothetical protein [Chloroflexota bacterium]MBI5704188.1 hypothetical protein [Chloroflexota bacterium]